MLLKNNVLLFWNSATKMLVSSIIIIISFSISICSGKTINIADEIRHLNCGFTNDYFVDKLELNKLCNQTIPEDIQGVSSSASLELCMAYLQLNRDFCGIDSNSTDLYYRSNIFDDGKNFNLNGIRKLNDSEVDEFVKKLKETSMNIDSFYKLLTSSQNQYQESEWSDKFFKRISSSYSECELLCGEAKSNVKDVCNILLWARSLAKEQSMLGAIKTNNISTLSKQQSSNDALKPINPSSVPEYEMQPNDPETAHKPIESHVNITSENIASQFQEQKVVESTKKHIADTNLQKVSSVSNNIALDNNEKFPNDENTNNEGIENNAHTNDENINGEKVENKNADDEDNHGRIENADGRPQSSDDIKNVGSEVMDSPPKDDIRKEQVSEANVAPQVAPSKVETSNIMNINEMNDEVDEQEQMENMPDQQQLTQNNLADQNNGAANDEFADGAIEDGDGDDANPPDTVAQEASLKQDKGLDQSSAFARGNNPIGNDESHFYSYFISMGIILVLLYLMLHYKKKLVALAVEGRRGRTHGSGRRRPNTASYSKLDSNLEEAMASNMSQASVTHVLY